MAASSFSNVKRSIWRELNLGEARRDLAEASSARNMMEKILNLDKRSQLTIVMLLWLWWGQWNKWREEGRRRTAGEIAYLTAYLTDRFQKKTEPNLLPEIYQRQKRRKPHSGFFKVNTAGSGSLLDVFHAELLGCLAGMKRQGWVCHGYAWRLAQPWRRQRLKVMSIGHLQWEESSLILGSFCVQSSAPGMCVSGLQFVIKLLVLML